MENYVIIKLAGVEANDYLQRMTSNDVSVLQNKKFQHNSLINYQGRLIAVFPLLKLKDDLFFLVLPNDIANIVVDFLSKYLLRNKVTIKTELYKVKMSKTTTQPTKKDIGAIDEGQKSGIASTDTIDSFDWGYSFTWLDGLLCRIVTSIDKENDTYQEIDYPVIPLMENLYPIITKDNTGTILALRAIGAIWQSNIISLEKGCYPGQEIVSRTVNLSKQIYELEFTQNASDIYDNKDIIYQTTVEGKSYFQLSHKVDKD